VYESPDQIKAMVEHRFVEVALDPLAEQRHPIGPGSAKWLGSSSELILQAEPPPAG
jgi:hypothetical protein